jgi:hypothetical protein
MPLRILSRLVKSLRKRSLLRIRVGRRNNLMKMLMRKIRRRRSLERWYLHHKPPVTRVHSWDSLRHRCLILGQWLPGRIGSIVLASCLLKIQDR